MELDKVPLWRGENVGIKELVEDFARYVYLPHLADSQVLRDGIARGLSLLTEHDTFAYAESQDEAQERYRGLRAGRQIALDHSVGLLVKPEVGRRQMEAEAAAQTAPAGASKGAPRGTTTSLSRSPNGGVACPDQSGASEFPSAAPQPKRFHGTVNLAPDPRWSRRRTHCGRGDFPLGRAGRCQSKGHLGNRGGSVQRHTRQRGAHGKGK